MSNLISILYAVAAGAFIVQYGFSPTGIGTAMACGLCAIVSAIQNHAETIAKAVKKR